MGRLYTHILTLAAIASTFVLVGCATTEPQRTSVPPMLVPSAAITNPTNNRTLAYHALPRNELDLDLYPRGEKTLFLPALVYGYSAFSDYTYDAQPIASPQGTAWRYRRVSRTGFTSP